MNKKINNSGRLIKISKFISFVLRHKPQAIGVTLGVDGWVEIENFLSQSALHGNVITLDDLKIVVAQDDKQRYSISQDGLYVRANQGHSAKADIKFPRKTPPEILFHGTSSKNAISIKSNGLSKMKRHHVHLSTNPDTALNVGSRHGEPIIFQIKAKQMHIDGYHFYFSENKIWLTDNIPSKYIKLV